MKSVELHKKLDGILPISNNGIFWNDDVLYALEILPMNYEFSGDTYVEILEEFLPKIEMDFEGRAEDYASDLWEMGSKSKLAKSDVDLSNIIDQIGKNGYFHENDIDKNTLELRTLIDVYKKKRGNEFKYSFMC
jgi:hypothetical protein